METYKPLVSTAYLPTVDYMATVVRCAGMVIEQHETFPKQTFRNRTVIATANGPMMLNVPVTRPNGNHTTTADIGISYHEPWNIRHWRAIVSAYNAAPYFLYYRDELESILLQPHEHLIKLNDDLMRFILRRLKIDCTIEYSSQYIKSPQTEMDCRDSLTSKKSIPCNRPYSQVFESRLGFLPGMSVIDLLFNLGPEAKSYLIAQTN